VRVIIRNQQKTIPVNKREVKEIVNRTLKVLGASAIDASSKGEITVVYVDNKAIQELNWRFLREDCPTDVLCFDLSSAEHLIVDIIISTEKACENAKVFGSSTRREMCLYLIHGILHLCGYNDHTENDRIRMQRKALQIMKSINIAP